MGVCDRKAHLWSILHLKPDGRFSLRRPPITGSLSLPTRAERWLSGRKQRFAKPSSWDNCDRGFESRSLRHFSHINNTLGIPKSASEILKVGSCLPLIDKKLTGFYQICTIFLWVIQKSQSPDTIIRAPANGLLITATQPAPDAGSSSIQELRL